MLKKLKIGSDINNLRIVENAVDSVSGEAGMSQENYGKVIVATMEAVNNAITHGNKQNPEKCVEIEIHLEKRKLKIKVTDEGSGFNPEKIPDPTAPENIELVNGRGVFLMYRLADGIKFNRKGNSVELTFNDI
jgi:serine/threonine-protein kinase RsbW